MPTNAEWTSGSADVALVGGARFHGTDRFADGLDPEERANQITHGFGFLMSLPAAAELSWVACGSSDWRIVFGCLFYAATLVLLYGASTLSHSFPAGRARDTTRLWDQVCIYLLTLGSVTAIALAYWPGWMLATVLAATWIVACIGIYRKVFVEGPNRVTLWFYVALGWFPAMGIWHVISQMPVTGGATLLFGAACYSVGLYFWLREGRIPYSHAVWHVLVLFGSFAHYAVIRWYVAVDSPLVKLGG